MKMSSASNTSFQKVKQETVVDDNNNDIPKIKIEPLECENTPETEQPPRKLTPKVEPEENRMKTDYKSISSQVLAFPLIFHPSTQEHLRNGSNAYSPLKWSRRKIGWRQKDQMRKVSEENYSSISHTSKNSEKEGEMY